MLVKSEFEWAFLECGIRREIIILLWQDGTAVVSMGTARAFWKAIAHAKQFDEQSFT